MNVLPKDKRTEIELLLLSGKSLREVERESGAAKRTIQLIRQRIAHLIPPCPCGQFAGHRGWCSFRYQQSLLRQFVLHPKSVAPIIDRMDELWKRLPPEYKEIALRLHADKLFARSSLSDKMSLLECGMGWLTRFLEDEKRSKELRKEKQCLREARLLLKKTKELLRTGV
jgi:hypothetical protein